MKHKKTIVLMLIMSLSMIFPFQQGLTSIESTNTNDGWDLWFAYSNGTRLMNGSTLPAKSYLYAVSNQSVKIAYIYVDGKQNQVLSDWQNGSFPAINNLYLKIAQGGNTSYKPFSAILPINSSSTTISMTAYNNQCSPNTVSNSVSTNSSQATNFNSSTITNSTSSQNNCNTSTNSNSTPGFEFYLILPSIMLLVLLSKKKLKGNNK